MCLVFGGGKTEMSLDPYGFRQLRKRAGELALREVDEAERLALHEIQSVTSYGQIEQQLLPKIESIFQVAVKRIQEHLSDSLRKSEAIIHSTVASTARFPSYAEQRRYQNSAFLLYPEVLEALALMLVLFVLGVVQNTRQPEVMTPPLNLALVGGVANYGVLVAFEFFARIMRYEQMEQYQNRTGFPAPALLQSRDQKANLGSFIGAEVGRSVIAASSGGIAAGGGRIGSTLLALAAVSLGGAILKSLFRPSLDSKKDEIAEHVKLAATKLREELELWRQHDAEVAQRFEAQLNARIYHLSAPVPGVTAERESRFFKPIKITTALACVVLLFQGTCR